MQEEIKIPRERIAILIGEKGVTKRQVEKVTKTKIDVNSKDGDVFIDGEDSLLVVTAGHIVKAIGRGFNPNIAMGLAREDTIMEMVNIQDFVGSSKKSEEITKARIIGTGGKARKTIETMTDTQVSIYGKTVAIIGKPESVFLARRAVEIILNGAPHSHAYMWVRKQIEREEATGEIDFEA
jgi:ribosomal RNA assembly protein